MLWMSFHTILFVVNQCVADAFAANTDLLGIHFTHSRLSFAASAKAVKREVQKRIELLNCRMLVGYIGLKFKLC